MRPGTRSRPPLARLCVILPAVFGLQACAAFSGVTPTNLEPVLVGTPRATVEQVLGSPSHSEPNGCGSVDTYGYNRGRRPEPALIALGMLHPAAPLVVGLVSHPFLHYGQKAELEVVYDANDTVIKYGPRDPRDWDSLFSNNHLWMDETTREDVARHYHGIGTDGNVNPATRRNCLCQAARLGHADSQRRLAEISGQPAGSPDDPSARVLARFETAAAGGDAPPVSESPPMEHGMSLRSDDRPAPTLGHEAASACAPG